MNDDDLMAGGGDDLGDADLGGGDEAGDEGDDDLS
jgi:hypothetical protein